MATACDVAEYILHKLPTCTHLKLQKLCYYAQAWSLVWDDKPLFPDRIEAWANGPVVAKLYSKLRGKFDVSEGDTRGDRHALNKVERETVDAVLLYYGKKSAHWLSELTHSEAPWVDARKGLKPGTRGNREISKFAMSEYYSSIQP